MFAYFSTETHVAGTVRLLIRIDTLLTHGLQFLLRSDATPLNFFFLFLLEAWTGGTSFNGYQLCAFWGEDKTNNVYSCTPQASFTIQKWDVRGQK